MIALYIYTVAAFGLAYIVGHAVITRELRTWLAGPCDDLCTECGTPFAVAEKAREEHNARCPGSTFAPVPIIAWRGWLVDLIECPACFGFWVGLAAGLVYALAGGPGPSWLPAAGALYTTGSNCILGKLTRLME